MLITAFVHKLLVAAIFILKDMACIILSVCGYQQIPRKDQNYLLTCIVCAAKPDILKFVRFLSFFD